MERQRNQFRRLHDRLWGTKWSSATASDSPIWILGICYQISWAEGGDESVASLNVAEFLHDFSSRIWFTYRQGFEPLGPGNLTSDVGWGCMLRSGQMLLAQALVCHHLGRDWRRDPEQPLEQKYLEILQSFGDCLGESCPFSIHNLVNAGSQHGLVAGSWLGPYSLCRTLERLAADDTKQWKSGKRKRVLPMAVCVVSGDAEGERGGAPVLCVEDMTDLCAEWENGSEKWAPLLLLVPLVLGVDKVNPGGKQGGSTYIVGIQDDQALYLDPHEVQQNKGEQLKVVERSPVAGQVVRISLDDTKVDTSSYHCSVVRRMALDTIDPSLALGFYCQNRAKFEDLCTRAAELAKQSDGAPMFTVAQTRSRRMTSDLSIEKLSFDVQESSSRDTANVDGESSPDEDWQIL